MKILINIQFSQIIVFVLPLLVGWRGGVHSLGRDCCLHGHKAWRPYCKIQQLTLNVPPWQAVWHASHSAAALETSAVSVAGSSGLKYLVHSLCNSYFWYIHSGWDIERSYCRTLSVGCLARPCWCCDTIFTGYKKVCSDSLVRSQFRVKIPDPDQDCYLTLTHRGLQKPSCFVTFARKTLLPAIKGCKVLFSILDFHLNTLYSSPDLCMVLSLISVLDDGDDISPPWSEFQVSETWSVWTSRSEGHGASDPGLGTYVSPGTGTIITCEPWGCESNWWGGGRVGI